MEVCTLVTGVRTTTLRVMSSCAHSVKALLVAASALFALLASLVLLHDDVLIPRRSASDMHISTRAEKVTSQELAALGRGVR